MFSLREILLVSSVLLLTMAVDTGTTSEELMPEITASAIVEHSWWENGNRVHKYKVRIVNENDVSICRLGFEITGGTLRDMWGLEKYNRIYKTSEWLRTHSWRTNEQAGFISVGNVNLKLVTVSQC